MEEKRTSRRSRRSGKQATPQVGAETAAVQPARPRLTRKQLDTRATLSTDERRQMIESAAYYRAERRGFAPGHEIEDWLAAESEINSLIVETTPAQRGRT